MSKFQIKDLWPTNTKDLSLEEGIFNIVNFCSAIVCFAYIIIALLLEYSITTLTCAGIGFVSYSAVYVLSKFYNLFSKLLLPYILFTSILTITLWFALGGFYSDVPIIFVIVFFVFMVILPRKKRTRVGILMLLGVLLLVVIQFYFPELIRETPSISGLTMAMTLTSLISMVVIGGVTHLLKHRYELDQKRLKEKNKDLAKATKSKSQFLANMSHEIRTPMNGVIGMTELLGDTNLTEEQAELLNAIHVSGERLLTIINEILDFSKIESGERQLSLSPFDLVNAVEEAIEITAPKAVQKQIELNYWIENNVPSNVFGDQGKLQQVLINLIGNAIKFTETGEVLVKIKRVATDHEQLDLLFEVIDTGIGIPEKKRATLFDAFTQVDESNQRKFGGTGLGLAISKFLVEMMGGQIWVESTLKKGSTFFFTINVSSLEENNYSTNDHLLKDKRILVVDDHETNRWVIKRLLSKWGAIPYMTNSAAEATAIVQKKGTQIDLAIIDAFMPQKSGLTLGEELFKQGVSFPMVLFSSGNKPAYEEYNKIFVSFIRKPIKQQYLLKTLSDIFEQSNQQQNTAPQKNISTLLAQKIPLDILIVEDDFINQKVVSKILGKMGYHVDIVNNGVEALSILEKQSYDLIFMDIQMPEMDGFETTTQIRNNPTINQRSNVIIAMTANAMEEDRDKCLAVGMDDYISKPVIALEIENAIKKWHGS